MAADRGRDALQHRPGHDGPAVTERKPRAGRAEVRVDALAITEDRERQALIVAAENIPGVKSVKDHLAWVDPTTGMVFTPESDADQPPQRH